MTRIVGRKCDNKIRARQADIGRKRVRHTHQGAMLRRQNAWLGLTLNGH